MTSLFCLLVCSSSLDSTVDPLVTYENIRAPLRVILSDLSEKSKVKITLRTPKRILTSTFSPPDQISNLDFTSTIHINEQPLSSVIEGLASLHGLTVQNVNGTYELDKSSTERSQQVYVNAENILLKKDALARLTALVPLTDQAFEFKPVSWSKSLELDSSPEVWAKARIGHWPYYLAGMWHRSPTKYKIAGLNPWSTQGFWIGLPDTKEQAAFNLSWLDEGSKSLPMFQTIFAFWPITGQLRAAGVYPDIVEPEPAPLFPFRFPAPPAPLHGEAFATSLKAWQNLPSESEQLKLSKSVGNSQLSEGWHQDARSLSEILFSFCKPRNISFISDAYRITAMSQQDITARTMQELGSELVDKQKCFVRQQGDLTLVRNPAYWRLQQSEPTFDSLAVIEQVATKRRLSVIDYADFLASNNRLIQVRFDSSQSVLTRFDASPISASGPSLYSLGLIPTSSRQSFFSGKPYVWKYSGPLNQRGAGYGEANQTTELGPFYSAHAQGMSRYILQGVQDYSRVRGYYDRIRMRIEHSPLEGWPWHFTDGIWIEEGSTVFDTAISFGFSNEDKVTYRIRVP